MAPRVPVHHRQRQPHRRRPGRAAAGQPASISAAVAYLDQLELITRERDGRRERYVVDDDVWVRTWLASVRDAAVWAAAGRSGADVLGADTPAGARLHQMSQFFDQISKSMYAAFEQWQRRA